MKYSIFTFLALLSPFTLLLNGCPEPEVPTKVGPPLLEAASPFDLEESPKGISVRKTLVLTNTGDSKMRITDFKLKPDNGVFLVGISKLPLNINRNEQKEITVTFRPTLEQAYTAELSLEYNHEQVFTPDPIELQGLGISNLICLSCQPPPEPECSLEGEASIIYQPTTSTDCENENGICSYLMFEEMCEYGLCDEDTKQCPLPEDWDAGVGQPDAGSIAFDAGMSLVDSGIDSFPPVHCLENEYVSNNACEPCPQGTTNAAGDDASANDTACEATLCNSNQYVSNNACEPCPQGTTNAAGDDASANDTACEATLCNSNQYVSNNACEPCPQGTTNAAGDDASANDTACEATLCNSNQYVSNNACEPCPQGTTNAAGDDASNNNTSCETTFCGEDEYVLSNLCEACPTGEYNAAGDDASGANTSCSGPDLDGDGVFGDDDEYPNHHNGDLQFLLDLIAQSNLSIDPLALGDQTWENYRLAEFIDNSETLTGSIPLSVSNITEIRVLSVFDNQLDGLIPDEIGQLNKLTSLNLGKNFFSEPIPQALANLQNLELFDLGNNPNFTSNLPEFITTMTSLEYLFFANSNFSGPIPDSIGNLVNLKYLDLSYNNFSGTIPAGLKELTSLLSLRLDNNQLSGGIPQTLGNLTNLSSLKLKNNDLTGSLPSELGSLVELKWLELNNNELSGSLPPELGDLASLERLLLQENDFSGSVPATFSNLTNLEELFLQNNQLTGNMPDQICSLSAEIDIDNNLFCPAYPSCLTSSQIGAQDTSACTCENGFAFNAVNGCVLSTCPDHASGAPNCECDANYTGSLNWDSNAESWLGACIEDDPCDGISSCPVNSTCTPTSGSNVGAADGSDAPDYTCECDTGFQDNDSNDTCMPDCSQRDCLNAIACEDSSGTAECLSDELSCGDLTETTNGTYYIDPDGIAQGEPAFLSYCEMETDGGGWTAFFAGYNGDNNVFAHFENNNDSCPSESSQCLRHVAPSITTSSWFAASCGEKMIKFQINAETLALFQSGQQSYWEMLSNVSAIKGTVSQMPDRIWSGDPGGAQGNSWVLTKSDSGSSDRNETFSSSYSQGSHWDYCDGVSDNSSPIYLFYR